jgi:CRP/FNR family transcriptional regulator, anaerobic regulatory protein
MKDMLHQSLISLVQQTIPFNYNEELINKSHYLIYEGSIERDIYIIIDGAVHAFFNNDGIDISIRFGYKGSIITSLPSLLSGKPSDLSIQAIRKTRIIKIPSTLFYQAVSMNSELNDVYKAMLEDLVCQQLEREIDLLTASPTERYERVLKRSPMLFQEIPAKYIASYLRMTPETLSRIRKS